MFARVGWAFLALHTPRPRDQCPAVPGRAIEAGINGALRTHPYPRFFLLGILFLSELLVGVTSGGPPLKKPIFYASSAMLTL
jgi:hypothetical protein